MYVKKGKTKGTYYLTITDGTDITGRKIILTNFKLFIYVVKQLCIQLTTLFFIPAIRQR